MAELTTDQTLPAAVPTVVIQPSRGWTALQLRQVWVYRELLYFMVWRDIKVRYKQTALGVFWIILQPIISMLVFSGIFGVLLQVPSGNIPYPLFTFAALLPWNYFAGSLTRSSNSLVSNTNLITKVYFPRLLIPLAGVLSGLVDFAVGFVILLILMVLYGTPFTLTMLWLPMFLLLAMLTALGFGLWFAAFNVRFRDVMYLVPFLVQIWMYVTPVIYGTDLIPVRFQALLGLNPMTLVVEGFRWSLFGTGSSVSATPTWIYGLSLVVTVVVLVTGLMFFRRTERTFADIV
jgi:lipopolysaccharide transport system permease protein